MNAHYDVPGGGNSQYLQQNPLYDAKLMVEQIWNNRNHFVTFTKDGKMHFTAGNQPDCLKSVFHPLLPQTANSRDIGQRCWWGTVPIPSEFQLTTPTDPTKPIGGDGELMYPTTQCTIEQLDDFLIDNRVEEAVNLLRDLEEKQGIYVDLPRYLQLIRACGEDGTLPYAKDVHSNLIRSTIPIDANTYNKILEMYSDCGSMFDAYEVFENSMPEHNIMSWDIMIRGLAKNDLSENAIDLFTRLLKPNGEIFMGVFLACSFLCDVGEGMLHFESMSKETYMLEAVQQRAEALSLSLRHALLLAVEKSL